MEKQAKRKLPRTHKELEELIEATSAEAAYKREQYVRAMLYKEQQALRAANESLKRKDLSLAIQALSQLASANAQIAKELGFATSNLLRS